MAWTDIISAIKPTVAQWAAFFNHVKDLTIEELTISGGTTNDVTTSKHGLCPVLDGDTTHFLRSDGTQAVPPGAGDLNGPAASTDNAIVIFDGLTGKIVKDSVVLITEKADLASPAFTGTVTIPIAKLTTGAGDGYIPVSGADGTLTPTAPTGTGSPVKAASPTLSGTPLAPTAAAGTNSTQIATTAFVRTAVTAVTAGFDIPIGVEWTTSSTSPTLVLVNQFGAAITLSAADWARHPIYGAIRRCNLSDAGVVNAYYGDATFSYTGSNGQVMVEIPKFYYKTYPLTNKYRFVISPVELPGYKIHPAFVVDSVEKDYIYISAFEGSVYDVTTPAAACVNTIQITAEPTSNGNLTITLDGNYVFTVAILDADSIEGVVDKIVAAGAKTSYQGTVWTPAKTAADTLTYTAGSNGLKTTVLMPTACGVTSTITKTNAGAGGYVLNDANGVDFTATTGDLLCSVAGVKPMSGWNNATATLTNIRKIAKNRGAGWNILDFNSVCAVQLLFIIRNATLNSQAVYRGVVDITDATAGNTYNNAINTGFTAGVGTNGVDLGNASGECPLVTHYKTTEAAKACSIFGIENFWGNIYKWVDGLNIKADRKPWIADHDFVENTFAHPYVDTGFTLAASNNYGVSIAYSATTDYAFLPLTVGGADNQYLCDYYYQTTGNRSALLGGLWNTLGAAGAFYWNLAGAASHADRTIGGRLAFK